MATTKQNFKFGPTVPVECYIEITATPERHWHRHIELNYVLSGHLEIKVKEQIYSLEEDQIILINPYDIHEILTQGCELAVFNIDLSRFDHTLINEAQIRFDCNGSTASNEEIFVPIKSLLARFIHSFAAFDENSQLLNKSLSYAILHCLMQNFKIDASTDFTERQQQMNRMEEIIRFINNHYAEPLTLSSLADQFFLSIPYLSKIFKKYIGTTFTEYMNGVRLSHAIIDISKPDVSIEKIGEINGFSNTRSFVAAFKKQYGIIPSKYRKEYLKSSTTNKGVNTSGINFEHQHNLQRLAKYISTETLSTTVSNRPAKIVEVNPIAVDQKGFNLKHNFLNTTSISKAKHILFAESQEMLITLQKEIGFKFIKFHGLLDDDMMVYSETADGTPEINFSYIDKVIDFLLSINLRPFMQLSFMPSALAESTDRTVFFIRSIISLPKDNKKWSYLIHSLILHLLNRYGSKEVEKWPFSLWNKPDSPDYMFGFKDNQKFFELYKITYDAIKTCNKNIIFGAPACMSDTLESGEWMNEYLEYCKANDCMPDFLNFHFYPIDMSFNKLGGSAQTYTHLTYLKSPNALKESITKINANSRKYKWNIPVIYLTEWNFTISHRDLLNDTAFKSAYIVKNILENYDQINSFGYWVLSDFIEEVKMTDKLYHGGLGLLTYNGIKKSGYYAFCLLKKLGDRLLNSGDGYFVTKSSDCYQIIMYNYQHFSNIYASGELFDMTFTNRYTPFPTAHRVKIVIPLYNLPNSEYILTETIINREHGSSFDKWVELGALPLETQDDVNYLKSVAVPYVKKRKLFVENNLLTVSCELEPHEVRLIEIRAHYHD